MKIPRLNVITLGVRNVAAATEFYRAVLHVKPNTAYEGVSFIELPGAWLSLYPIEHLARDIDAAITPVRSGFTGITLAHNVRSKSDVLAMINTAREAGATILKEPQETFWGGYSAFFSDPDGYIWEIVWGPMFEFSDHGDLRFKKNT